MRNIFFGCLAILITVSCSNPSEENQLSDLNLMLESEIEIDSVFISNETQDREYMYIPYSDNLYIEFNDSINDSYNIHFFSKEFKTGLLFNRLWLSGEEIIIKGTVGKDRFKIDTVINSDLYYHSKDFRARLNDLIKANVDSATIDDFLISELKKNMDSPFSIEIANKYFYRNPYNRNRIKRLYNIMIEQEDSNIIESLTNPLREMERIFSIDRVDLSQFKFHDIDNQFVTLSLEEDKRYILDYWFIGCAPCIKEHQEIKEKYEWLLSQNVVPIGVSIDQDHDEWNNFIKKKNYPWGNFRDIVDNNEYSLRAHLMITLFPAYLLIDSEGNVLARSNTISEILNSL